MTEILRDHTLVIPTYNRPGYLSQLVAHLLAQSVPVSLLVLDSSKPEIAGQNAVALAALGGGVRHLVFPTTLPMARKLAQGLAEVATPYVSFCADDDLVFPEALAKAVAFLADHPDYVSAHGLYLNFQDHGHDVHVMREYAGPGNESPHAGARIFRLFQKYESLFYGVFRTGQLRQVFDGVSALPTLHYQELFQSVAALMIGKVHRFLDFYAARRSCEAAQPERDKWQTFYWFADNPAEVVEHYVTYREALWTFYGGVGAEPRMDRATLFKVLDLAHASYFAAANPTEYFYSVLTPLWGNEPFQRVERIDLFRRLRYSRPHNYIRLLRWGKMRLNRRWRVWRQSRRVAAVARLDAEITANCRQPWACRLSPGLQWLAGNEDFRVRYGELCHYLDLGRQGAGDAV